LGWLSQVVAVAAGISRYRWLRRALYLA